MSDERAVPVEDDTWDESDGEFCQSSSQGSESRASRDYPDLAISDLTQKNIKERTGHAAIKTIADLIITKRAKNIVVLTGAGVSTSAGIPDFRSPSTGLYHNLQRLNLPFPEAIFELNYFKDNPEPFWALAKELYPGKHFPTPTHYFVNLLARHSILCRVFTQNIDTLETLAGVPPNLIIEAHGSFASAHCLSCKRSASTAHVFRSGVRKGQVVRCAEQGCRGLVKPDIVFFGEGLPDRFFDSVPDLSKCDLLMVMGTSLQVAPFSRLPDHTRSSCPRFLINREAVGPFTDLGSDVPSADDLLSRILGGSSEGRSGDMFWEGDADEGVRLLAEELGWREELEEMIAEGTKRLEEEWKRMEESGKLEGGTKGDDEEETGAVKRSEDAATAVGEVLEQQDDGVGELQKAIEKELNLKDS